MIKAALFDLDGVVFDTEPQYTLFWGEIGRQYHSDIPDFAKRISSRTDYNWINSNYSESIIEQFNPKKEKLKNYNIFPVDT